MLGRLAKGISKEAIEDQLRIAFPWDWSAFFIVGDVAATNLIRKEAFGREFK